MMSNAYTQQILAQMTRRRLEIASNIHLDTENPLNFAYLATQTEGYSATDLQDLVSRAIHQLAIRVSQENIPVSARSQVRV
jgi:peroxin-1